MNKLAGTLATLAISASVAWAQPRATMYVDLVEGGSLIVTNDVADNTLELKRVQFALPTAVFTNAFTIAQAVRFALPDVAYTVVETNLFLPNAVTTNTYYRTGGVAQFTNTITVATTTNTTLVQVYDEDNFGKGWLAESEDVTTVWTFAFTETNAFYMIRTYNVYPRP
jgi:hypothetical protein